MALLNPINGLAVPFLFLFTIPLAIFAGITTMLAFSVLMVRVLMVYLDLAMYLVPRYLLGRSEPVMFPTTLDDRSVATSPVSRGSSGASSPMTLHPPPLHLPALHHGQFKSTNRPQSRGTRSRHPSSAGTTTPKSDGGGGSGGLVGMAQSVGIERDFEGVGGWRLDDDENWTRINSRLELPGVDWLPRHHQRSRSGGPTSTATITTTTSSDVGWLHTPVPPLRKIASATAGEEGRSRSGAVSPNSSRARAGSNIPMPLTSTESSGSYFADFSTGLGRKVAV